MGRSRVKRGLHKVEETTKAAKIDSGQPVITVNPPIPDLARVDMVFGDIRHMPRYETVPDEFKRKGVHAKFISKWFFSGLKQDDMNRLKPKPGVDQIRALGAISAIMRSFEPKHEHKEAGCAFLLHAWFEVTP